MLKRAWLVICILWTALCIFGFSSIDSLGGVHVAVILFPWLLGPLLFYIFRFIFRGRFSRW